MTGWRCSGLLTTAGLLTILGQARAQPEHLRILKGHEGKVQVVSFSPDGKTVASAAGDFTVRLWDVESGKEKAQLKTFGGKHGAYIFGLAFTADGKFLITAGGVRNPAHFGQVIFWDLATKKVGAELKGHNDCVTCLAMSPDGKAFATGDCLGVLKIWDVASRKELATLKGHTKAVGAVAFHPSAKAGLLASGGEDAAIRLWDVTAGKELASLPGYNFSHHGLAFSPDGKLLASTGARHPPGAGALQGDLTLWDVPGRKQLSRLSDHGTALQFISGGKQLVVGTSEVMQVWDVAARKQVKLTEEARDGWEVRALALSPDGTILASGSGHDVRLWKLPGAQ